MGIKLQGEVHPSKAGFIVTDQYYDTDVERWVNLNDLKTDKNGKIYDEYSFPEGYPQRIRLYMRPQTVDGVEYKEYTSAEQLCDQYEVYFFYLYPEPVSVPSASVYIPEIDYWIEGMSTWGIIWSDPTGPTPVDSPNYSDRPAKVNEALYFTVWWQNIGEVAITGHADLELTAPSGAKHNLNAYSGQDKTQSPNIGQGVGFNGVTLNEAGVWSLKAVISYAGIILDKETTTFTVGAPAEEGKAEIIEVNLPDKLSKGDSITGYVKIKNVGTTKERFRHFLTTEWNGKVSKTEADLRPGDVLRVNFYEGGLIMPAQEAHMTIRAQHWDDEIGDWITDDIKTH